MNWNNLQDFLHMGGYGLYVWGSFFVVLFSLIVEMQSLRGRRRTIHTLLQQQEQFQHQQNAAHRESEQ